MADFKFFTDYYAAEKHWLSVIKLDHRGAEKDMAFRVDTQTFIAQLEELQIVTGDPRFKGAIDALRERGMDGPGWASPVSWVNGLEDRRNKSAIEIIDTMISEGVSLRLAIANAAANLRWPGNSFAAAVKSIERLYRTGAGPRE